MHGRDDAQDVGPVPVDLVDIDAPEFGVGEIGEDGPVVEPEEREDAEHDIGVGALIGNDDVWGWASVGVVDEIDDVERVFRGAGDDFPCQSYGTVRDHVEPGHATFPSEVFGVRSCINGADRHHETHAINRSYLSATPKSGEPDFCLRIDEHAVCSRVGVWPEVVLIDMSESFTGQLHIALGEGRCSVGG